MSNENLIVLSVHILYHSLDPIWTVKTGSLFLLDVAAEELFIEDGMKFVVKDFDQFGGDEALGLVTVPPRTIYQAKGDRMEFKLQPVPGKTTDELPGYLAIRCRRASPEDISFMHGLEAGAGKAVAAHKMPKVANNALKSIVSRTKKIDDGVQKVSSITTQWIPPSELALTTIQYKARPCPDPKRKEETEWMTKQEIEEEVMKPSQFWTDAGSGKVSGLGSLLIYFESILLTSLFREAGKNLFGNLVSGGAPKHGYRIMVRKPYRLLCFDCFRRFFFENRCDRRLFGSCLVSLVATCFYPEYRARFVSGQLGSVRF